ncbi:hypothetical protein CANCADRAFT_73480 [Tortispora caseinolytica NRRL Y-17796]|uniref:Pre-rRNA-processing protein IPI3 n=1 Tax=Tortispora caseinolytica NRRL Y-17796 TaxID=767744 RepID=A0A1E4TIM0_9ASCO|nr:hypothetical protein CANCADRAFT_73480 [Tortispora caseinolytica NRRL Y-17796]
MYIATPHGFIPLKGNYKPLKTVDNVTACCLWNNSVLRCTGTVISNDSSKSILPVSPVSITSSHSHQLLAVGSPAGQIIIWFIQSGQMVASFNAHFKSITSLAFSADDALLVSSSTDGTLNIYNTAALLSGSTDFLHQIPFSLPVSKVAFSTAGTAADGIRIYAISEDQTLSVWDALTASKIVSFVLPSLPTDLVLDPADRAVYVSAGSALFAIPQSPDRTGLINHSDPVLLHSSDILALALSPDASILAIGDESGCTLYDVASAQQVRKFGTSGPVSFMQFTTTHSTGPFFLPFQRSTDEVPVLFAPTDANDLLRAHTARPDLSAETSAFWQSLSSDSEKLAKELKDLKKKYDSLQSAHNELYKAYVDKVVP